MYEQGGECVADVGTLRMFVLDEADEMLSRGFKEQIYDVFKNLPGNVQVQGSSAVVPNKVQATHFVW